MPNIPPTVLIGVIMPYFGYKKKIIETLHQLTKRHRDRIPDYVLLINTVKWTEMTWKDVASRGVLWHQAFNRPLARTVDNSIPMMEDCFSSLDYIRSLSMKVRATVGKDHYKYLVYAVRTVDRTIPVAEFNGIDADYVEIEVGDRVIIGALLDVSLTKDFLRQKIA